MNRKSILVSIGIVFMVAAIIIFIRFYDRVINGYTNKVSYNVGETASVFIHASRNLKNFKLTLYDINMNRVLDTLADIKPQEIPKDKPWENGFGYDLTFTFKIPNLPSGIYLWEKKVPFIIKSQNPEIVVLYGSNTVNAYNIGGGKSLYSYDTITNKFTNAVSFLRPADISPYAREFLKWFQEAGYSNVGYICDYDLDNYDAIANAKLLIITGHSEYWTRKARENFDRFVDAGNDAIILAGNTMWWQVRYSDNGNQLICYKNFEHDTISDPLLKTINWDQPALQYPIINSIGLEFGRAGFGTEKDNGWDGYKIINENSPLLEGTGLKNGNIIKFKSHEQDGTSLLDVVNSEGFPIIDKDLLDFSKIEIVGYDSVSGYLKDKAIATWITMKKTQTSGVIINVGSTNWCKDAIKNENVKKITRNMIEKVLKKENVFSTENNK